MYNAKSVLMFKSKTQQAYEQIAQAMDEFVDDAHDLISKARNENEKVALVNALTARFYDKYRISLDKRTIGNGTNATELYNSVSSPKLILELRRQFTENRNAICKVSGGGMKLLMIAKDENGNTKVYRSKTN